MTSKKIKTKKVSSKKANPKKAVTKKKATPSKKVSSTGLSILVVDDEPLIRLSLSRAFQSRGATVHVAGDGLRGEQMWKELNPDIVVLDVLMPGLTGPQLIEKAKGDSRSKIVLISAYSGEYDVDSVKILGADLFISKPFQNIFDVVDKILGLVK